MGYAAGVTTPDPHSTAKRARDALGDGAVTAILVERIEAHPQPWCAQEDAAGLELRSAGSEDPAVLRLRVKIFRPDDRRIAAFFYKRSQVPGSRDRYGYGGAVLADRDPSPAIVDGWLEFLASGFDPERRPADLRRALPFEVPEDP
jgi:hypothetical protein